MLHSMVFSAGVRNARARRVVVLVLALLLACIGAAAAKNVREVELREDVTERLRLSAFEEIVFPVQVRDTRDVEALWSTRTVSFEASSENFSVFLIDTLEDRTPQLKKVFCHLPFKVPFFTDNPPQECSFSMSPYGMPSVLHDMVNEFDGRPHYVYITVRNDESVSIDISIGFHEEFSKYFPIMLSIGFLLYFLAPIIGASLHVYLVACFAGGALFSILILLVILLFILSRQQFSFARVLTGMAGVGYLVLARWFVNTLPGWSELLTSKYVIAYLIVGGCLGLWKFYRSSLDEDHVRSTSLVLKLFALAFIFQSVQITSYALFVVTIVCMCDLLRSWIFFPVTLVFRLLGLSYLLGFLGGLLSGIYWWLRAQLGLLPSKQMLTLDEFDEQGRTNTRRELDDLREYLRENPQELCKFDPDTVRQLTLFARNDPAQFLSPSVYRASGLLSAPTQDAAAHSGSYLTPNGGGSSYPAPEGSSLRPLKFD